MRVTHLRPEFTEFIPSVPTDGILYISVSYATATHGCCCGCGNEVVAPLSTTDWTLRLDGETVSLDPSIGNWSFPCPSHYWIMRGKVVWAPKWGGRRIAAMRDFDAAAKEKYYAED